MIKYLYDERGNKTDVLVPVKEWEEIVNSDKPLYLSEDDILPNAYLEEHYIQILELVQKREFLSQEEWVNLYNEYFKYYNALDRNDINLLFYLRQDENIFHEGPIGWFKSSIKVFKEYHNFSKIDNSDVSLEEFLSIRDKAEYLNEFAFLQYFKSNYRFEFKGNFRNRLFVHDLLKIYTLYKENNKYQAYYKIIESRTEIIKFIANNLYNGQDTAVYRLENEAYERLEI
jgi:hypothetical protein